MYNALVAGFYGPATTTSIILQTSLYTVGVSFQLMAAKKRATKPKGIVDDIAKGIQSLVSATQPKITDPQSLAEFKATTKNILKTGATVGDAALTGGLGGSLGKNVIAPGAMVASPKTRSQAQNSGLGKFGVEVGVTAASVGAGAGVAKIVKSTGVVQRALNSVTKQQVIVHGSPTGAIKTLKPSVPKANPAGHNAVYGMNPSVVNPRTKSGPINLASIAMDYADAGGNPLGSAYVAKVPVSGITNPSSVGSKANIGIVTSKSPAKVVAEIKMAGKSQAQLQAEILKAAKQAGAKIPKTKARRNVR